MKPWPHGAHGAMRWSIAMPIAEGAPKAAWPGASDEEEQRRTQTHLEPRALWPVGLSAAVVLTAAVRVALLVSLHG